MYLIIGLGMTTWIVSFLLTQVQLALIRIDVCFSFSAEGDHGLYTIRHARCQKQIHRACALRLSENMSSSASGSRCVSILVSSAVSPHLSSLFRMLKSHFEAREGTRGLYMRFEWLIHRMHIGGYSLSERAP